MSNISIITVTYNSLSELKKTVHNVFDCFSDCENVELIIVDGASDDGTRDFLDGISSCDMKFKYISEPDSGIYSAMNKGVSILNPSSEYIIFMNAGDYFTHDASEILKSRSFESDIHVFNVHSVDEQGNEVPVRRGKKTADIKRWPSFPHQGTLIKSSLHRSRFYDETFRILADYDFFAYCYAAGKTITLEKDYLAVFVQGGVSSSADSIPSFIKELELVQMKYFRSINHTIILSLRIKWLLRKLGVSKKFENFIRRVCLK